jgi:hypothetical protein
MGKLKCLQELFTGRHFILCVRWYLRPARPRQLPPLAANAEQVDDCIEDCTAIGCARTAAELCRSNMRFHQRHCTSLRSEG